MINDDKKDAVKLFRDMYGSSYKRCVAVPDPHVDFVWLVIGKEETDKSTRLLGAIVYIKYGDVEEISVTEALQKYPKLLPEVRRWVDKSEKRIVDVGKN